MNSSVLDNDIVRLKLSEVFTIKDVYLIKNELDEKCPEYKCIPRKEIYKSISDKLSNKLEEATFCLYLSHLINLKIIEGFEVRTGRSGGIHRQGLFSLHDKRQKELLEKKTSCIVHIYNEKFLVKSNSMSIIEFVVYVLDGTPNPTGPVRVNELSFFLNNLEILKRYIIHRCSGQLI